MKKMIALLLAVVMVLGLAACGNSKPASSSEPAADPSSESPAQPAAS